MAGSPIAQRIRRAALFAAMALPALAHGQTNPPLWDVSTGKVKFAISATRNYFNACWITADGKEIALFANNNERGTIHYFDSREGQPLRTVKLPKQLGPIFCAEGGQVLAYPMEEGRGPSIIDPKVPSETFTVTESVVRHAAFSRDGKLFAFSDTASN